jgi:hypothetical protein
MPVGAPEGTRAAALRGSPEGQPGWSDWLPCPPLPGAARAVDARHVIAETDQALAAILKARVIGNAAIAVAFDPPNRPWIQALQGPAVNLFLFDIKENAQRRDVMFEEIRDENHALVARRPPPPRVDLHYAISAWAPAVLVEHNILAAVLRCFISMPVLPREALPAALKARPHEVMLTVASGPKRGMFMNVGGDLKAGFDLCVTVPLPLPDIPAAPVVQQATVTVGQLPGTGPAQASGGRESLAVTQPKPSPPPQDAQPQDAQPQGDTQ